MKLKQRTIAVALLSAGLALAGGCAFQVVGPQPPPPVVYRPAPPSGAAIYQAQIMQKAERGDPVAQYIVGTWYASGKGVPLNHEVAVRWFRRSAEHGYAVAESRLGLCYSLGLGVVRNYTEAARWFRRAADQGNATAQYNLGNSYYFGRGVPRDGAEAMKWYRLAAGQGSQTAQARLRVLANPGVAGANPPQNLPNPGRGNAKSEPSDAPAQDPLTLDEIKLLSSSGVKPETLIAEIGETHARFSPQDIDAAQQANPAVDPTVIQCMKNNAR
jgi:TPR repeat protein